ncbi:MAG: beta-lactamase family protein [Microbacterium sp.]|nr:beta-lactamase family protein [Microbacterium sp.]
MSAVIHGHAAPGLEAVAAAFEESFAGKPEMGAALSVRHRGRVVVDLWGGCADPGSGTPWGEETASVIFSCTKGLVSVLAAQLVQEGLLDYEAPVVDYWPEYGAAGKAATRVKDVLAHRAGLSAPRVPIPPERVTDWAAVTAQLAAQEPLWEPGSAYAYHAITHGWLAGELVRRVGGESVGERFRRTIAEPLGAAAWIGLPPGLHDRVAHMTAGPTLLRLSADQEAAAPHDGPDWLALAMTLGGAFPRELVGEDAGFNDRRIREAEIPGAGGIATARALATIWSATFIETDGVRLLGDATIEAATEPQSGGEPFFAVPPPWPRWGMGLQLDSEARRYLTPSGFGHDGAGGQVAFADPTSGVGFAFLTNQMEAIDDVRATRVVDALRAALA